MSLAILFSRAQTGVDAPLVTVEVHLSNGLPALVARLQSLRYGDGADVQDAQAALRRWLRTLRPLRVAR